MTEGGDPVTAPFCSRSKIGKSWSRGALDRSQNPQYPLSPPVFRYFTIYKLQACSRTTIRTRSQKSTTTNL